MSLRFEPVTPLNRANMEQLDTTPEQTGFVESVKDCLAEADKRKSWRPVGIYDGDLLVGFAMYGFFWEYFPFGRVWLDRLLIDSRYQGRGYGKTAVTELLAKLYKEYHRKKIYLSVYDNNTAAINLYQELGFCFNGQLDMHGEKIMVHTHKKNNNAYTVWRTRRKDRSI